MTATLARATTLPAMPAAPSLHTLARSAAATIVALLACVHACALEAENDGGNHEARLRLPLARGCAIEALIAVADRLSGAPSRQVRAMVEGCRDGFARDTWTLRVVRLASEVGG